MMFHKKATETNSKSELGALGEKLASAYLKKNGYKILKRNVRARHGELDIIAADKKYIVFVEVKSRSDTDALIKYGRPATAVNQEKRGHILSSVKEYLRNNKTEKQPRIDIIEVYFTPGDFKDYRIEHIKNAFGADGK